MSPKRPAGGSHVDENQPSPLTDQTHYEAAAGTAVPSPAAVPSLAHRLAAYQPSVRRPPAVIEAIDAALADIERSGLVPGVEVGQMAPLFVLPNAAGDAVALADRLAAGPVVLTFYRGAWCPYCNIELRAYQQALPAFHRLGANIVAVSPQAPDDTLAAHEKAALEFDVLSDSDQAVIAAYHIRFELPDTIRPHLLDTTRAALASQPPDRRWSLPVPATFVLDSAGVVRARQVSMNYRTRMEPADALAHVEKILAEFRTAA